MNVNNNVSVKSYLNSTNYWTLFPNYCIHELLYHDRKYFTVSQIVTKNNVVLGFNSY